MLKEKAIRKELKRIERLFEADAQAMEDGRDEYITGTQIDKLLEQEQIDLFRRRRALYAELDRVEKRINEIDAALAEEEESG